MEGQGLHPLRPAPYNTAMIASMIAHDGAEATEKWLRGVKANPGPQPPADRDVARDILGGIRPSAPTPTTWAT